MIFSYDEQLSEIKDELIVTNKKLTVAVENRVPEPDNSDEVEDFVLLKNRRKNPEYKYYAIRSQRKYAASKVSRKLADKFKVILKINNIPNSVNLWNRLKTDLKKKGECQYNRNEINLISITEDQFIEKIKEVYDERKIVDISADEISDSDNY